jgi:hypothetical protein
MFKIGFAAMLLPGWIGNRTSVQATMTKIPTGKYILSTDTRATDTLRRNCDRNVGETCPSCKARAPILIAITARAVEISRIAMSQCELHGGRLEAMRGRDRWRANDPTAIFRRPEWLTGFRIRTAVE